jgi:hypothetical protein
MTFIKDSTVNEDQRQVLNELNRYRIPYQLTIKDDTAMLWSGISLLNHTETMAVIAALQQFYTGKTDEDIARANIEIRAENCPVLASGKPQHGIVYLLQSDDLFKIGISTYPVEKRLQEIKRDWKGEISVVHFFESDDIVAQERTLHNVFANKQVSGEWFRLDRFEVDYIKSLGGAS